MKQKTFTYEHPELGSYVTHYIKDKSAALKALRTLMKKDVLFGIDTETAVDESFKHVTKAALSPYLANIRLIQVFDSEEIYVFDCYGIEDYAIFIPFLETKKFIAHYAMFELSHFYAMGVTKMQIGCTRILSKLIFHAVWPTDAGTGASLEDLCEMVLKIPMDKRGQTTDWSMPELTFEQVKYAALDAVAVIRIAEKLAPGLKKLGLERSYELSKNVQHPLVLMQLKGWAIDKVLHQKMIASWRADAFSLKREIQKLTGMTKITSGTIAEWLTKNLDDATLEIWPKTDTGRLSTDANAFVDFGDIPIVKPFSQYQKKITLSSTFGQKLSEKLNAATGRLHGSFNILGARTGRLSASNPNLQNAVRSPSKAEKAAGVYDFRDIFVASPGRVLVCADYSQIELRVAAEVSQDPRMQNAYRQCIDLHKLTASKISGKPLGQIEDKSPERQLAKAVNFGLLYGLGANKFSHYAKKSYGVQTDRADALKAIEAFRETYSGYRAWQLKQSEEAAVSMQVRTPCGKLRKLDNVTAYGGSMNTPIQGGAAEVMQYALIRLFDQFKGTKTHLVSTVHDEVIVECEESSVIETEETVARCMIAGYLDVFPNGITKKLVEAKHGLTWGEAK